MFWTFGDLSKGGWDILLIQAVIIIPSVIYFMFHRWNYNALDSGDEAAISLGANIKKLRINGMIIASAATAVGGFFLRDNCLRRAGGASYSKETDRQQ